MMVKAKGWTSFNAKTIENCERRLISFDEGYTTRGRPPKGETASVHGRLPVAVRKVNTPYPLD